MFKIYAVWNEDKKGFSSAGYGCVSGINIITFNKKEDAERFAKEHCRFKYKIKGISVA